MLRFSSIVPVLRVADVARSISWYQTILGFTAEPTTAAPPFDGCRLHRDGVELMLRRATGPVPPRIPTHGDWELAMRLSGDALVSLLDAARRRTPLVRGPEVMANGQVEFELEDPDGNRVCNMETVTDTTGIPRAIA
jgi:catechol 2,3-dioxygenase-like lactoylglutathione lyase family enzyme